MTRKSAAELQDGDRFTWGDVEWEVMPSDEWTLHCISMKGALALWIDRNNCIYLSRCFPNGIPVTPKPEPVPLTEPCKFCAHDPRSKQVEVRNSEPGKMQVVCLFCRARGSESNVRKLAIEAWNSVMGK